jgi:hypothetical protein
LIPRPKLLVIPADESFLPLKYERPGLGAPRRHQLQDNAAQLGM